jgi:SAM-dependent methyltransferase
LEDLAEAVRYRRWLCRLCTPYLGDHPIEIGAGSGDYAREWLDLGVPRLTLVEVSKSRYASLSRRFASDGRVVTLHQLDVSQRRAAHSAAVALNVLEHVEADEAALRAWARCVRPGGFVIIFVPAFRGLMSRFDRELGHLRRYRQKEIRDLLARCALDVEECRYVNLPGYFAWFVVMRVFGGRPRAGMALRVWDRVVVPLAAGLERRWRVPFGQSVLAIARVRDAT